MFAKYICRFAALALLASAPALGVADDRQAGNGQEHKGTGAKSGNMGDSAKGQKGGTDKAAEMVFMLVPVAVASKDNSMKSGCWTRIYSGANYSGDTLTLTGPVALADMTGPFGLNWDDKVDSLEMGPKATLTVFDNEGFRDQVGMFKPGQKVPDISRRLGFFDEFASVRLTCAK